MFHLLDSHFRLNSFLVLVFLTLNLTGCSQIKQLFFPPSDQPQTPQITPEESPATHNDDSIAEMKNFIYARDLGRQIVISSAFQAFLDQIENKNFSERMILARVDQLSAGEALSPMASWDLALEEGIIDGLVSKKIRLSEKLDDIHLRTIAEIGAYPPKESFYLHPIRQSDHSTIRQKYEASYIILYQLIDSDRSTSNPSAIIYFKLIDLRTHMIEASMLVQNGSNIQMLDTNALDQYEEVRQAISSKPLPADVLSELNQMAVINSELLSIHGVYNSPLSNKAKMAIENGLTTALLNSKQDPFIVEKYSGFKLKYPSVHKNILFNTNPLIYEEWKEFIERSGCKQLLMYRYVEGDGIYLKIIDAQDNGAILFSDVFPFSKRNESADLDLHDLIVREFSESFPYEFLKDKNIAVIDGNQQAVDPAKYRNNRTSFSHMRIALEEGLTSSLVKNSREFNYTFVEKLKTIYLKQPWMYEGKVFNLNPLYLDNWSQLKSLGYDTILLYNNLIPYEALTPGSDNYKQVSITIRLIDLETGEIPYSTKLSTIGGDL